MSFYDLAMVELDKLDGTLQAEFVDILDGYYYEEIRLDPDEIVECEMTVFGQPTKVLKTNKRLLKTPTPRYRKELVWKRNV